MIRNCGEQEKKRICSFFSIVARIGAMNTIYLMRHGETEWNIEKRYQGRLDSPLTETGELRTRMQKKRLEGLRFNKVYCSPLGRTRATLEILKPEAEEVRIDPRLMEVSLGVLQGKTDRELNPEEREEQHRFWNDPENCCIPEGESLEDLEERIRGFLEDLKRQTGPCLVITHTVIIKMILKVLESRPVSRLWAPPYLHPATILTLDINQASPVKDVIHPEEGMVRPEYYIA